uniref:hypothetical protein n=1 Tax=Streptomyces sp. CA-136453 TaxID=3240050 RepID=UPI003F49658B
MPVPWDSAAKRVARYLDGEAPTPHDDKTLRTVLAAAALKPAPLIGSTSALRVRENVRGELHRLRAARRAASSVAGSHDGLDTAAGDVVSLTTPDGRTVRAASSFDRIEELNVLEDVQQAMHESERTQGSM